MLPPDTQIKSRYAIVKTLGRGGMGAVYLARALAHPDLPSDLKPGSPVAIKQVLSSHLEGEERLRAREAFEQEANLLARLRHPGLVRIFEHLVGEDESYLVMEYVDGLTLSQIGRRLDAPLPFARVQYVTHQICQVLGYLHQLDPPVIFRDLKPSNIMVDRTYKMTLIDFGIARVFEEETRTQTYLRGVGSAGYAPLEQYTGGTDPRSDVYSLGATLYTLLTKLVPPPAALRVVGSEEIQEIEVLNPHAPPHWCKAVRKMLRLRREERYPSVAAVEKVLFSGEADETTSLLLAPKVTVEVANAVLLQRLGLRRPDVAFQVGGASYQEQDQVGLPADLVLCLKHKLDEQCGLSVVLSSGVRKAPQFELGVDHLAAYLVPEGDRLAPPQMVMPGVRSALRDFAPKALQAMTFLAASEGNLKTIAQLSSLLSCGEAAEQAARLEMQWRLALKIAQPQDWLRLAQNLRQYRREAAEEFLDQAFGHWQESALEWNKLPVRQGLPQHQALLEELKSLESDGRYCLRWLDFQSAAGRAAFRHNWLSLELTWRQSFPQLGEDRRADCLLAMAQHLMDQAEYSRAEPLATAALELAEKTLGPDNPSLSPYLRLYANVCDHCGKSKKSTEFRTRALLLKHRCPMDELNTLISSMAAEGNVDSSGVFTLDLAHAELKLQDYRLPDPALFILNLVASAVCSGAHFFQVETERQQTRIFFNGQLPHAERLAELFTFILKDSPHPANRELALALHGATALPGSPKISLTVCTREGTWAGEVEGTRILVQEVPSGPIGVKVVLQYNSPNPLAQLLGLGGNKSYQRIVDQLWHFCRHAPLDFKINGRSSGSSVSMGLYLDNAPFARRFLQGEQAMRLSKPGTRRHDIHFSKTQRSPLPSSILVGLADRVTAEREGFLLISRGVVFKRPHALLGCAIACAVVTADHLEKDLSQTDLVEGEEFAQLVEVVRQQIDELIQEVLISPPIWSPMQAQDFEMGLMDRYPDHDQRPVAVEAFLRSQRLGEACRGIDGARAQLSYLAELQSQKRPEAKAFGEQLTKVLEARLADTVAHKQWTMVTDFLECLHSLRPLPNDYRLALYFLADQLERGRLAVIESAPEPNSQEALLRYLFGWNANPPNSSMLSGFFELERAVFEEDHATALLRANELEEAFFTPFLGLWLGWFHWSRHDYKRTAALWYQTLSSSGPEVNASWYPVMWAQISGKVSLPTQIRWQARQGYRQLFGAGVAHEQSLRSNEEPKVMEWSQKVWQLRSQGQHSAAQRLFLTHFLRQALDVRGFSLTPFSSTTLPTALPTS